MLPANDTGRSHGACSRDTPRFGELLREYRRAAGLTQEELAEQAGVSPRSISGWESGGAHLPRRDTLAMLVRALGLHETEREALEAAIDRPAIRRPLPQERPAHNLPRTLSSFVGRERELNELQQILGDAALLTLVGTGGVGKTRLALELVRDQVPNYADGVWLVELAGATDSTVIPGVVAAAVGLRDADAPDVTSTLTEHLRGKHLLLVLDNCEHQVDASARLAAHLLRSCPRLHILATSREPLAIEGEIAWRVPPLELPDVQHSLSPDEITSSAAVRLFVERVHAVNHVVRPERRQCARDRAHLRRPGRHSAGARVGCRSRAGTDSRAACRSARVRRRHAWARGAYRTPTASHHSGDDRLEPRPSRRARADAAAAPVGLRRRLDAGDGRDDLPRR